MGFADELVVPGSGPVGQVLLSVAQLCAGMNENQAACERLLRRLTHIFDELKTMEERCQLPASGALGKYAAVVAKFLDYLKRYRGKRLAFRIIKHQQMQDELREIHDGMDVVFAELNLAKGTDWKQQSEGDQRTQHKLLKSMAQNSFAVKRELQQTRTQLEAMLTLQFEASQVGRHSKEALELIRSMMGTIVRASKTTVEKLPPWYLPPEEIQVEPTPLAQGSFASAHYGTWGSGTSVVVKRFHVEDIAADERVRQQVVAEISMWYQCNHPNVCKLFGGSHVSAPPFLVCENATNSDMASFLARSEANKQQMWRLLYEAALGLDYLHRQGVIHGELKLRNILVGADGQAKLSDFGLSAIRSISTTGATAAALRWRAPESPKKLTFASDVFALGMCCIEAVTGQPPFADLDDESARYKLIQGVIPDKPADMPTEVWELVESTVKSNPEERLELQEVLKRLKAFADIAVVQEPTVQIFASRSKETLTDSKGTMLRDLAVPGSGAAVVQVLDSIAKLCLEMKEGQATYQRLHQRLQSIFDELEKKDRLPSPDTLKMYVDVVAKTLLYLERHRKKNIVARLILHQSMMEKVREINEDIDMVFKSFSLAEVDAMMTWKQQWEADQRAQDEQMKAMVSNTADVMSELQSSRSQLEALMMLKFETEHRGVRQNDKAMELLQSMMTTVAQQSKVTMSDELPPWFIPSDEIEFEREPFAMGAFASVHHGVCKLRNVVVKRFLVSETMEDEHGKQIENEMNLWYEFDHPNVIKMYGASHVSSPPFIVCEDATSGDLASFLARSESNKRRTWSLLYQAALGLQYLHSKKVVHGDLKLNNILVSADGQAKVSDFGCAMRISENGCPTTRATFGRGGLRWRAPECLTQAPTFASDVYSFAMCIIEAVSGEPPFTFLDDDSVLEMVKNGAIPDKPGDMLTEGWELVMAMANRDPSKRAALSYVIDKLNKLAEDEERMKKPQHEEVVALESPRRTEDSTFDTMGVLDLVAEVSAGRETEEALRYLLRASINDEQRALMYKINGVQKLISLLKVEQSYFAQLFVLQCLKWSMVADSMLTTPEFEEIRKRIRKASKSEVELVVADLKTGSDQEKEKAVVLCACIATRGDTDSLFKVGAVQPLVALLRENDVQKLWAAEALGNIATESDAIRAQIVQGEAIASLVALILVGTEDQKHRAAYALGNLALSKDANELIVRRGVIGPLVGLVHTGTRQQKTTAEVALENLVRVTYSNPVDIAREQSTDPLIALVQVGSVEQKDSAACALMAIARTNDALRADIERDGGVSLFIALLRAGSDEEKNYAACKLRDLAVKDAARVQIVRGGGIAFTCCVVEVWDQ